jgi:predicted SAM-dependent methyltransferase
LNELFFLESQKKYVFCKLIFSDSEKKSFLQLQTLASNRLKFIKRMNAFRYSKSCLVLVLLSLLIIIALLLDERLDLKNANQSVNLAQFIAYSTKFPSMNDYCSFRNEMLNDLNTPLAVKKSFMPLRNIYIGSSQVSWFGWESFSYSELDVTNASDFSKLFCKDSINAFLSEHTFEHIPYNETLKAFKIMYSYLRPGGFIRTAIPTYPNNARPGKIDLQYGHVNYLSADKLVDAPESVGFVNAQKKEWVDYDSKELVIDEWDFCSGPIRRSFQYDSRNVKSRQLLCNDLFYADNGNLKGNRIPLEYVFAKSTIVDAYKKEGN